MLTVTIDYKTVLDSVDEMIILIDENQNLISMNKSSEDKLRINPGPAENLSIGDLIGQTVWEDIVRRLEVNDVIPKFETALALYSGEVVDLSVKAKKISSGGRQFYVLAMTDITGERKQHLELIRFSNALNKSINPIQITDEKGLMIYVNPAFELSSGYTKNELIGKNPRILSSHKMPKEFWENVWSIILSGKVWSGQIENKRKDGTSLYTDAIISPIIDEKGKSAGYLAVHKIITDLRMLEQHLSGIQRLGSMGILAAGIAHEIGNPLASISSIAQLIKRSTDDELIQEKLDGIKKQTYRIAKIIRQLVEFSNPSTSSNKSININKLVVSSVNTIKLGTESSGIEFDMELGMGLPNLHLVSEDIMQVILNLLLNSVESLKNKSGKITIRTVLEKDRIEIIIRDDGKGIPRENLYRIFEPFFTTKPAFAGAGLGLWGSYGIVRNIGGDILVESNIDAGSKFTVLLPLDDN